MVQDKQIETALGNALIDSEKSSKIKTLDSRLCENDDFFSVSSETDDEHRL